MTICSKVFERWESISAIISTGSVNSGIRILSIRFEWVLHLHSIDSTALYQVCSCWCYGKQRTWSHCSKILSDNSLLHCSLECGRQTSTTRGTTSKNLRDCGGGGRAQGHGRVLVDGVLVNGCLVVMSTSYRRGFRSRSASWAWSSCTT